MGKCCKCGKETKHEYAYYRGTKMSSVTRHVSFNARETTTVYANVVQHRAFLCMKCTALPPAIGLPFISIALAALFTTLDPSGASVGDIIAGSLIFFLPALACLVRSIGCVVCIAKDKWMLKFNKELPNKRVIAQIRKKEKHQKTDAVYPGNTFFTPSSAARLR